MDGAKDIYNIQNLISNCNKKNTFTRKQPENFVDQTLNKYNIRTFDYENMLFIIGSCFS